MFSIIIKNLNNKYNNNYKIILNKIINFYFKEFKYNKLKTNFI